MCQCKVMKPFGGCLFVSAIGSDDFKRLQEFCVCGNETIDIFWGGGRGGGGGGGAVGAFVY